MSVVCVMKCKAGDKNFSLIKTLSKKFGRIFSKETTFKEIEQLQKKEVSLLGSHVDKFFSERTIYKGGKK